MSASQISGISNIREAVTEWLMCLPLTPGLIHTQGEWWPSGNVPYTIAVFSSLKCGYELV